MPPRRPRAAAAPAPLRPRLPAPAAAALSAPRLLVAASLRSPPSSRLQDVRRARLPRLPSSKRVKATSSSPPSSASPPPRPSSPPSPTAFVALAVLNSGYKLSKNSAKVVEGFLGFQVHKGFRNRFDALGVIVKLADIASEVAVYLSGRFLADDGGQGYNIDVPSRLRTQSIIEQFSKPHTRSYQHSNLIFPNLVIWQKDNINRAVKKFLIKFDILLFHYDGRVSKWDEFAWSKRAIHKSVLKQAKWWYAKRFLHHDIVAHYEYIFIWDVGPWSRASQCRRVCFQSSSINIESFFVSCIRY